MKLKNSFDVLLKITLALYCSAIVLSACVKDDQPTEEAVSEPAAEGEEAPATEEGAISEDSAATDAAATEEASPSEDTSGDADSIIAEASEGDEGVPSDETIPAESASEPEAVPIDDSTMSSTAESKEYDGAGETGPIESASGLVVRYVRSDSLSMRQGPNKQSAASGNLNRGDVVLVTYQGEWAQLENGSYVSAGALSSKGIGRKRVSNGWKSQQ